MKSMNLCLCLLSLVLSACAAKSVTPTAVLPAPDLALPPVELAPVVQTEEPAALSVPFVLHDNRMVVDVTLNGQGPFVMIFDTGAANSLTPETMRVLDLKSQGPDMSLSKAERKVAKNSVHIRSVDVGGYKLQDQKFAVANLSNIRKAFQFSHLDGVIGFQFLQNARVRIDFDANRIEFLSPTAPALQAERMKFELFGDKPVVNGTINGKKARIVIDTGDRSNLTLFRRFAHKSKLEKIFVNRDEIVTGMGTAGPITGKLASVQSVDLGGREVKDVLARLPMTRHGYFYTPKISASAGIGLLKGFNIEIDMKAQTIALQARKNFNEESTFVPVRKLKR